MVMHLLAVPMRGSAATRTRSGPLSMTSMASSKSAQSIVSSCGSILPVTPATL